MKPGWAEQDPGNWWENLKLATQAVLAESGVNAEDIKAIGISYQMHGLVCVDKTSRCCVLPLSGATPEPCPTDKGFRNIGRGDLPFTSAEFSGQLHGLQTGLD